MEYLEVDFLKSYPKKSVKLKKLSLKLPQGQKKSEKNVFWPNLYIDSFNRIFMEIFLRSFQSQEINSFLTKLKQVFLFSRWQCAEHSQISAGITSSSSKTIKWQWLVNNTMLDNTLLFRILIQAKIEKFWYHGIY